MRRRDLAFALLAALCVTVAVGAAVLPWLAGYSLDITFWLRERAFGPRHDPATSPTVVIAIDEESYRARDLFGYRSREAWTPELTAVLRRLLESGAAVIGFDIVLSTSMRELVPNYDRDYLVALRDGAREGRIVLGRVQHSTDPIVPTREQNFAVQGARNTRALNLWLDDDQVIRRVPLTFQAEDQRAASGERTERSFSLELAMRAANAPVEALPGGGLAFRGRPVPGAETNNLLLNFEGGSSDIPTFSFQDLVRCSRSADREAADAFFRRHFSGRVILLGVVADLEDRKLTSKRMMTGPESGHVGARCVERPAANYYRDDVIRNEIPGVYVHATAINNLLRGDALRESAPLLQWSVLGVVSLAAALVTIAAPLPVAAGALVGAAVLWVAGTTTALQFGLVLPLFAPLVAGGAAFASLLAYRFLVADRDKRLLRKSFALYLAPSIVDRLVTAERPPELGGEEREITVWFSDVAGFTSLSESLPPGELVGLMNAYLSAMTDIVEAHGGFVDKYIGDAIVAVFGAPLDEPDHARQAVAAALECQRRLAELNRGEATFRGRTLAQRIGINTGRALVGNIGSRRRFNYTVMGDTVNVASRLEGTNKVYGTEILVSETTVAAAGGGFLWREIDRVRVKGRAHPIGVFEPVALGPGSPAERARVAAQAAALAAWRQRDFAAAAAQFAAIADDPVAARFAERARAHAASPPDEWWEPVTTLESK